MMAQNPLQFLAALTMPAVRPKPRAAEILRRETSDSHRERVEETERTSIYIHPKALTFPIAVALVKGSWEVLKLVFGANAESLMFPLGACLILGMLITVSNLIEEKPPYIGWALGLAVGLLNSLVICGAVIGISKS
jgi:hypothetical protein